MDARENILAIRLKSMGDVLFTLPAIHALRENFPSAKITFLTSGENATLLQGFQEVDDVIAIDRAALKRPFDAGMEIFNLLRRLRQGKFSIAIDFQGFGETAWLSWWSNAPERWANVYGPGRQWAYTRSFERNDRIHHADRNLSLLQQCGLTIGKIQNEFILPDDALASARKFFIENNLDVSKPTLFLQPFTSTLQKNWPLESYLALAKYFRTRDKQIVFGGGPADRMALEPACAEGFAVSAGAPLLVSAGLAKLAALTVGGDTGLLHLAAAMGKRVLMLMVAMGQTYPIQHPDWVVTPPPGKTISEIETDIIIKRCATVLNDF